jgi:hypothetical protein
MSGARVLSVTATLSRLRNTLRRGPLTRNGHPSASLYGYRLNTSVRVLG